MPDFSKLIGVPYSEMNCWRLAQAFYREVLGLRLQHYYENDAKHDRLWTQSLIYSNVGDFEKLEGLPKFGDLILLNILGIESHIAVYVGEGRMLHTSKNSGSHIERVALWKPRIAGFYRLKT